jgi:hypothetical protein
MPSLSTRSGVGLESAPLFWVQDYKDQGVHGGWMNASDWVAPDFTLIKENEIAGATLKTRNGSDVEVVSGVIGQHGRTDAIINNPSDGTYLEKCSISLPAGKYYFDYKPIGIAETLYNLSLYNKTDDDRIFLQSYYSKSYGMDSTGRINISTTCEFLINIMYGGAARESYDLGYAYDPTHGNVFHDLKIYKIG